MDFAPGYLVRHDQLLWLATRVVGDRVWLERLDDALAIVAKQVRKEECTDTHSTSSYYAYLPMPNAPLSVGGPRRCRLARGEVIEPLFQWVPSPSSWELPCKGLYLSPLLHLGIGDTVTVEYLSGAKRGARVTARYNTLAKQCRALPPEEIIILNRTALMRQL